VKRSLPSSWIKPNLEGQYPSNDRDVQKGICFNKKRTSPFSEKKLNTNREWKKEEIINFIENQDLKDQKK